MPPPFRQITRQQFGDLIDAFDFTRKINAVHMHHTWRPDHSQYDPNDGHRAIVGMFLHHTRVNKWQDIAQHVTIAPDGSIWLGRNWNLPPASAAGHNGTREIGPFMLEIIGNFDAGQDRLAGEQRQTAIEVIAQVQRLWGLAPESLRFHNAMSSKSCPGTTVIYDEVVRDVRERLRQLAEAAEAPRGPFGPEHKADDVAIRQALDALGRAIPEGTDPAAAEPDCGAAGAAMETVAAQRAGIARDGDLTPDMLAELRPHLVNLEFGHFSSEGKWKTDQGDVDALFDQHLGRALQAAQQRGEPLRILFFAHGGLIRESDGLQLAHMHLKWWTDNHIYPIYFVWETGLFETVRQLLVNAQQGARNFVSDYVTDPIIELAVRALNGPTIWGGMKLSAQRASAGANSLDGEGGAHYVAARLQQFCAAHGRQAIELHAVGHSAGAVFHAHFLDAARALGVPSFRTLHLLAPAVRVDAFNKLLRPLLGSGKGIDQVTLFTMAKDYERADNCAQIYQKSLLYLIHYALEPEFPAPVLGLEVSLRADAGLRALFGLSGAGAAPGQAIFSVTPIDKGRSASTCTTHGGFDDDPPTMNSIARRVLGKADADAIIEYRTIRGARAVDLWQNQVDWPERLDRGAAAKQSAPASPPAPVPAPVPASAPAGPAAVHTQAAGRRRALCIGIDHYPGAPLAGCVADANAWMQAFAGLGFEAMLLRDEEATRDAIIAGLRGLIGAGGPGDVMVFQFAGHGTRFPDINGDEEEDGMDEVIVPFDYADGAYLIDDDVREILAALSDGLNLTCFFDCCHSGTNTRFAVGATQVAHARAQDRRKRFLPPTAEMVQAHQRYRARIGAARPMLPGGQDVMKHVAFSACQADEVAWESDGHGDYTLRAMRVLQAGTEGITNQQFSQRVLAEFGANSRQRPLLDCAADAFTRAFLQPLTQVSGAAMGWRVEAEGWGE